MCEMSRNGPEVLLTICDCDNCVLANLCTSAYEVFFLSVLLL